MLLTLQRFDNQRIGDERRQSGGTAKPTQNSRGRGAPQSTGNCRASGCGQRIGGWWSPTNRTPNSAAQFRRLEITKTYRLAEVPKSSLVDADFPAYHLEFEIEIRNVGSQAHKVAYRLDGPTGLPKEGAWYANKVSRSWHGSGLRDFVVSLVAARRKWSTPHHCRR